MSRLYIILFDLTFLKVITHIAKLSPPCCVECSLNLVGRTWAERILESNQNIASTMNALNNVKVIHLSLIYPQVVGGRRQPEKEILIKDFEQNVR